jgi:hypothetical protein
MNELSGYAKSGRAKAGWRASEDTSRDLGVGKMKKASQKPFDGDPFTRLAGAEAAAPVYGIKICSFQGHPIIFSRTLARSNFGA